MFEKRKFGWGIVFAGLIAIIIAAAALYASQMEKKRFEHFKLIASETDAVITDIQKERVRRRSGGKNHYKTYYTVKVKYNVDGNDYTTTLNYHTATMHEGDTVKLYYDPENPEYTMSDPKTSVSVLLILGVVFFLVGVLMVLLEIKNYIQLNSLIKSGQYVICDDWSETDSTTKVNSVRYHWIVCNYTDDRGGQYKFYSGTFHPNREPFVQGIPVKVYVDLNKPKVYFVSDDGHR